MSRGSVPTELLQGDRELLLLAAACESAFDAAARARVRTFASDAVDWPRFLRLAGFHRVQGLARHGLAEAGVPAPDALASQSTAIAARNLESAAACAELLSRFESAGLPLLFLKGLPLGVLAYRTPWLKAAIDIDLLIDDARLGEALGLLEALGYRRADGRPQDFRAVRDWHRFRKDSEWARDGSAVRVDLHTRLTDNPALIPGIGIGSPRQVVEILPGVQLPTLADDELFPHLCVHGASSAWFRLKWITDFAALVHRKSPAEIDRLYARSQSLGAGRAAGQALLLADALYGALAASSGLRDRLNADAMTGWLFRSALRQLAGARDPVEPTARGLGTWRIHLTQFFMLPGPAFKASELVRQARAAARR
jgi:Uncharacterised nucleotidyltransferase